VRRLAAWGVLVAAAVLLLRRVKPRVASAARTRCAQMCDEMLAKMPDSFPPNRMLADLDHLRKQTDLLVDALQHLTPDTTNT
jgi:dienelactone hydrolase